MAPSRASTEQLRAPMRVARALAVGESMRLDAFHVQQLALREINVKEAFTLVDADGAFFRASLKAASDAGADAVVYEKMSGSTESPARITLICAVLGRQRMIPVIQKATELGCVRVVPVLSAHAVPKRDLDKEKPWAWPAQAIRACRQSRRASVPEVLGAVPLDVALAAPYWREARARFVMDDRAPARQGGSWNTAQPADYVLAVGPEGGWSDDERARFDASGAEPLVLGTRVLRAETAVYAGLAILQHRLGDLALSTAPR